MIKNFMYNDIVLYAKGWYKQNGLLEDLGYLLSRIYAWTPKTEKEISDFMIIILDKLCDEKITDYKNAPYVYTHYGFLQEVNRYMFIYDCTYDMAVIRVVLSILMELKKDEIQLNPPHFGKKEHFRYGLSTPSMTYKEMNRIVDKWFNS